MKAIDLGREMGGPCAPCCAPDRKEKYYPSIYLEGKSDFGLPDEGTMTIKFRVNRESKTTSKESTNFSVDVECLEIVSVKGESKEDSTEAALDKLKDSVEEKE